MLSQFDVWLIPPHWGLPRSQPCFCWLRIQCCQTSNANPQISCCASFINKLLEDPLFDHRSSTAPLGLTPEPALLLLAQYTVPADDRILHKLQLCNLPLSAVCRLPPLWGLPRSQPYFCWLSIQSRQTVDPFHKEEMPKKKMYHNQEEDASFIRCLANTAPLGLTPEPALLLLAQNTVPPDIECLPID